MLNELTIPNDIPMLWQDRAERLRAEQRAAFGPGETVVDLITRQKWET